MHELGHNFGRSHGGDLAQLNGKPNYLSVMSYLFQLNGLFDDNPAHAGIPQLDFSGEALGALNESTLTDLPAGWWRAWTADRRVTAPVGTRPRARALSVPQRRNILMERH